MSRYQAINLMSGELVAVVEAPTAAVARKPYRGCKAVELTEKMEGQEEYQKFLWWVSEFKKNHRNDWNTQIMFDCGDIDPFNAECCLTEEETQKAEAYAKFLGVVVADEFRAYKNAYRNRG